MAERSDSPRSNATTRGSTNLRDSDLSSGTSPMSLRLRVWFACLAGVMALTSGVWWVIGTRIGPHGPDEPLQVVLTLIGFAGLGLAVGSAAALWLDHHIIGQLRGIARGLESGRIEELRDLPSSHNWGELSQITHAATGLLTRERALAQASEDFARCRAQAGRMRVRIEHWIQTERWEPLQLADGPLAELGQALDRGFARDRDAREQNVEATRLVHTELDQARADARESVEQAERGFVEATALLTSVRELQRLGGELHAALVPAGPAPEAPVRDRQSQRGDLMAQAIHELVDASIESVDHLGHGLLRVQEVAEQVRTLSNRSTLIALNATLAGPRDAAAGEELKQLARDVRTATERTQQLTREIEEDVATASTRMADIRTRVADTLERADVPEPEVAPAHADDTALRLMERVREMVQDATRKGERLSAAGERSSRAAQRLVRRLDDQARDLEGLVIRLSPPPVEPPAEGEAPGASGLRLLELDRWAEDESPVEPPVEPHGADPDAGEQR